MSSQQDYPSISQINTYVKKNAINVIFAVTAEKVGIYKQLQSHIEGSSCAQLSNDSSNIVELIKEQYKAISSTVEMKHNASSAVNLRFFTRCLAKNGTMQETNKCGKIKVGSVIEFHVQLEIRKCPREPSEWKQTIQIYPVGINESLIIDLEMLCSCPCERPEHPTFKEYAKECNGRGNYMCGVCDCSADLNGYGPYCGCVRNGTGPAPNDTIANCLNPRNGLECSGRGHCVCGKCDCDINVSVLLLRRQFWQVLKFVQGDCKYVKTSFFFVWSGLPLRPPVWNFGGLRKKCF